MVRNSGNPDRGPGHREATAYDLPCEAWHWLVLTPSALLRMALRIS